MDGRTLVPLRFVGEYLGADIQWDGEKRVITIETET
ncbi:stalk domain-containing protein [Pelotomaculum propionicicum]